MPKVRWPSILPLLLTPALMVAWFVAAWPATAHAQEAIRWEASIESAKRTAAQSNRLVLVLFTAPQWCVACRALESDLNAQPAVCQAIEANYVAVRVNADYYPTTTKQYNVKTLPTTIVLAPTARGETLDVIPQRLPLDQYLSRLNRVAADARRRGGALAQLATNQSAATGQPSTVQRSPGQPSASITPATAAVVNRPPMPGANSNLALARPNQPPQAGFPVGLDGYCPVRLVENSIWTPGQKAWGAIHRGRTYLFAGESERQRFLANPDRYAPVWSGSDVVAQIDQNRSVPGTREHGVQYAGHVYLFADETNMARFSANPKFYAERALESASVSLPAADQVR